MNKWLAHVFVAIGMLLVLTSGAGRALDTAILDWRFRIHTAAPSGNIAIVSIDAPSIEKLGVWPWPRTIYAQLLDKLRAAGAVDVAFDVDFSSRTTPAADAHLAEALKAFGGSAVLPIFKQIVRGADGPRAHSSTPLPEFSESAWLAAVNIVPDQGIARTYPLGETIDGQWYPSLATMLTGYLGEGSHSFTLDFGIDPRRIPTYSVADVLAGRVAAELKGKRLIVGATAIELGDRFTVPRYGTIAGVELQALAADAILSRRMLRGTSSVVTGVGLVAIMLLGFVLIRIRSALPASLLMLAVAAGIELTAVLLQQNAPVIVQTSFWHVAIAAYIVAFWLHELDLRGLVAAVAQKKFQSVAMALGDGVICTDAKGHITFWNPAAVSIFGCPHHHALGRPVTDFICFGNASNDVSTQLSRVEDQAALELVGMRADGRTFPLEVRLSSWETESERQYSAIVRDISVRKRDEERIRFLALNDELTGLANRTQLWESIKSRIVSKQTFAVLLLDLDNFKDVNDALGHEGGDKLLRQFASSLSTLVAPGSLAARLGGDEFAVVTADTGKAFETLLDAIARIFGAGERLTYVDGRAFSLSASIGSACYPEDGGTVDELLSHADIALYRAKNAGGARHVGYDASFKVEIDRQRTIEVELRSALKQGELLLHYQAQTKLENGTMVGVEALLRWQHPKHGLLAPGEFLPILEASNVACVAGEWILRTACRQGATWLAQGHPLSIGVNLFPCQFTPQLPSLIASILADTGLPAHLLEIEITENILLSNDDHTVRLLADIRKLGVRVALDDFGTGYASLTYLKRFPLDRLKIDRSFVTDFGSDATDTAIVTAIVGLSRQIGLSTIAEGIEDARCERMLRMLGCDEGQGYFYGRPMCAADIDARLSATGQAAA